MKRLLAILILALVCALPAQAQIAFVGSTEQNDSTNSATLTMTFDIGTRTDGLLVVPYTFMINSTGGAITVTSGDWNGDAVAKTAETTNVAASAERKYTTGIVYICAPDNGSNTLTLNLSGTASIGMQRSIFPAWFDNAACPSVVDDTDSGTGTTDPSLTLTSTEADTMGVAIYSSDNNDPLASDQGTEYQNHDYGGQVTGAKHIAIAGAGDQTLSWSGTDADYIISAANFKSAGAAPAAVRRKVVVF